MEIQEERTAPSRWTRARKKKRLLTDEELMASLPSLQKESIQAAKRVADEAVSITTRSASISSSDENQNTEVKAVCFQYFISYTYLNL